MANIYNDITQTIGMTPLVRIRNLINGPTEVLAKIESFNPMNSVKDRIGKAMIEAAQEQGKLSPGATLIEPTRRRIC